MRRAGLLLEVLLSLALFVMTALAILSVVRDAVGRLERSQERLAAADLARSAMAAIESGLYQPTALNGPVPPEGLFALDDLDSGGVPDAPATDLLWTLEIDTEPSEFLGLTVVTVSVLRDDLSALAAAATFGGGGAPVFSLRQLARLSDDVGVTEDAGDFAAPEADFGGAP